MKKRKPVSLPNFPNTRKALRKQKRQEKKVHRQEHYLKKKNIQEQTKFTPGKFVKRPPDTTDDAPAAKKKKLNSQPAHQDIVFKERQKEMKEADRLKSDMEERRRRMLVEANEEEDKIIKKLEKQLGLNKSKNKNNYFADDGLDYLLEICDKGTTEQIVAAEKHLATVEGESDFEEDLAAVTGKELKKTKKCDNKNKTIYEDGDDDNDFGGSDLGSDDDVSGSEDDVDEDMDDEDLDAEEYQDDDFNSDNGESDFDDDNNEAQKEKPIISSKNKSKLEKKKCDVPKKPVKEIEAEKSNNIEKIIKEDELSKIFSDDEVSHLSGDDENMEGFSDNEQDFSDSKDKGQGQNETTKEKPDVWEDIYGRKRDKEGNVIKEERGVYIPPHLRNKDSTNDQEMIQLNRQIRSAHFLEELTKRFDATLIAVPSMEDKTLDNIVSFLAHLYCFKIFDATLLYDILRRLLASVTEKNIECVVLALRLAGAELRRHDPRLLQLFLQGTHDRLGTHDAKESRVKFLFEVLLAVKNNNLTKIPNYDPTHVEYLKKMIKGIIRKGNYITTLNIRLEDLLKAEERGKWWVVGSAWAGTNPAATATAATAATAATTATTATAASAGDAALLRLARELRMNTDVRRNVFCVIMSAEDYLDAFEKLQQLGLRGPATRELVPVLLACVLREATYNPYYALLAHKHAEYDRKYQLSIQFCVWDKIKELSRMSRRAAGHLAHFLTHLILAGGLPLSVLKVIQFSDLNKSLVRFMRQILLAIIMNADLQASLQVFQRIAKAPKLHMFRESLRLFIQHFLIKNAGKKSSVLSDAEMATLKERALVVDKILSIHDSKVQF